MIDPLILAHSRAVAAPKRQPAPAPTRRPVHAMCLAMSEVYQWVAPAPTNAEIVQQAHARLSDASIPDWRTGDQVPMHERVGLWHTLTEGSIRHGGPRPAVEAFGLGFYRNTKYRPAAPGVKEGDPYAESRYLTAQQFVCIRAHKGTNDWKVGDIAVVVSANEPDNWRPCDAEGWIAHVPTADAVCPVPEGVDFKARWPNGEMSALDGGSLRGNYPWTTKGGGCGGLRAWRPVVQ